MENNQLKIETEYKKIKSCALTGHRDLPDDFDVEKLRKNLKNLIENGVFIFYNGLAKGFDLLSAEVLLSLKKEYKNVKIIACIPCLEQEKYYKEEDKKRYYQVLKNVDERIILSEKYYKGCMLQRDKHMVDKADVLLAYLKKETGGTAYTVKYFQKKYPLKEIYFFNR